MHLSRVSASDLRASVEGPTVCDLPGWFRRREFGSGQGVPSSPRTSPSESLRPVLSALLDVLLGTPAEVPPHDSPTTECDPARAAAAPPSDLLHDIWQPARISGMLGSAGRNRLLHHQARMEWGTRPSLGSRHEVLTTAPEPSTPPMNIRPDSVSAVRPKAGFRPAARQPQTCPFSSAQMITASPASTLPGAGFSGRSVCMSAISDTLSPKSAPGQHQYRRNPLQTSANRQDHLPTQRGLTCKNRGQRLTF
ncbi:hypothetical protein SO3561_03342 [Streptomyces olivochromogenes]|uniref:Uncharacterized protein n=1 Tax=Streptomyces olivochromogenes TaxID=1963 RepID=A0A250VCE4_STROL|nr:hypothetical protein SO3561_03342 [Streptomyces olivochromogenes]